MSRPARPENDPGSDHERPVGAAAGDELHTTLVGSQGPAVVFLHGLFGQGKNFATVAKALAPGYRSLLVDLPDHGRSPWTGGVDVVAMADSVAATVRSRLPGERVRLVGHSLGGKVAMVTALRHPELVEQLVVVDIAPVPTEGTGHFEHLLDALAGLDLGALQRRADADDALREAVPDDGVRAFLLQNLRQEADGWRWRANLAVLRRDLAEIGSFPHVAGAQRYVGPVLWVVGSRSPYVRPQDATPMRALFPRVRKVSIKGAGHWVHSEQPAAFHATLRAFLDGPPADGA